MVGVQTRGRDEGLRVDTIVEISGATIDSFLTHKNKGVMLSVHDLREPIAPYSSVPGF